MNSLFLGLAKELRRQGLKVQFVKGWKKRGRDGTFSPRGVMNHHTASNRKSGNAPSLGVVTHGRSDLPGPLCNILIGRNGTVYIVAAGRCNHAGYGGALKGIPKDSGNSYLVGIESENDGIGELWDPRSLHSQAVVNAVLLRRMKRAPRMAVDHKEWAPDRKVDRKGIEPDRFRKRVKRHKRRMAAA